MTPAILAARRGLIDLHRGSGAIPLAALPGNAISNDGDALFPAIALAPRAAIVATLYTGIPALLVGYGAWFLL